MKIAIPIVFALSLSMISLAEDFHSVETGVKIVESKKIYVYTIASKNHTTGNVSVTMKFGRYLGNGEGASDNSMGDVFFQLSYMQIDEPSWEIIDNWVVIKFPKNGTHLKAAIPQP